MLVCLYNFQIAFKEIPKLGCTTILIKLMHKNRLIKRGRNTMLAISAGSLSIECYKNLHKLDIWYGDTV